MNKNTISTEALMERLAEFPDVPLAFIFGDITINQGYHVTEVKHASIKSLDCGKHAEEWDELVIQLLNGGVNSSEGFMSTTKFAKLLGTSLTSLSAATVPYVFFEHSPDNGPLLKLGVESIQHKTTELSIVLCNEKAVCKPFERFGLGGCAPTALATGPVKAFTNGCCSSATNCCR